MPANKKAETEAPIEAKELTINQLQVDSITVALIGNTPLILNRMSAKAKQVLLVGGQRKTSAEKLEIKHNPVEEYREAMDFNPDRADDTAIFFPAMALKRAMSTAARVTAGVAGTDVDRLIGMTAEYIPIYGVPQLYIKMMRQAGQSATPDMRTRAIIGNWGTVFEVQFLRPQFNSQTIVTLLNNAGLAVGIGDSRQEKGKGSHGGFRVTNLDDDFQQLIDKDSQIMAHLEPSSWDKETQDLLDFWQAEEDRRNT